MVTRPAGALPTVEGRTALARTHDPLEVARRAEGVRYMRRARPRGPEAHLLGASGARHLLVADGSRLFDVDDATADELSDALVAGRGAERLAALGLVGGADGRAFVDDTPLADPPVHALSLAVAQTCNLGCTYCYAQQGQFGGPARHMTPEVADQAVDRLVDGAARGAHVNLAFLGGEPLAARAVLRRATRRAVERGAARGVTVTFSITTNGTLLRPDDADFFEAHGFAVTVSVDGPREVHDAQRPTRSGAGSWDRLMARVRPLLGQQRRMQVGARVTVTPQNLRLDETLDALVAEGFHSVGFSPMLASPTGAGEMDGPSLEAMLGAMIACGRAFERRTLAGERYPFANLLNALGEIARGTHRPYPCGAGAGYLGVGADGALAACHRFVGDPAGAMGSVQDGVDTARRDAWLAERHVHRQTPCNTCWARYLCGGGCHHEVLARGRPACDYVRGWLHYCLEAYLRLDAAGVRPWQSPPRVARPAHRPAAHEAAAPGTTS